MYKKIVKIAVAHGGHVLRARSEVSHAAYTRSIGPPSPVHILCHVIRVGVGETKGTAALLCLTASPSSSTPSSWSGSGTAEHPHLLARSPQRFLLRSPRVRALLPFSWRRLGWPPPRPYSRVPCLGIRRRRAPTRYAHPFLFRTLQNPVPKP
jgi:hypothetical protein